jgi:ADP-ribosylglycohydrolase
MACGIYISIASLVMTDMSLCSAVQSGIYRAMKYYKTKEEFRNELQYFSRIENKNFNDLPEEEIKSGGYVIDTLEASMWCLLNTSDFKSCVLKAVNLGSDTDTTGAVAGGLAGLRYGYESIPKDWIGTIARSDYIEKMCDELYLKLY